MSTEARRLILLGSTGSIGASTLDVVRHLMATSNRRFELVGLAAGRQAARLQRQAETWNVAHVAIADPDAQIEGVPHVYVGDDAAGRLVDAVARPGDLVVVAIMGAAGLAATLAAIERGCDIALANKETLVAAGAIVMPRVAARGVRLLPVDSEHAAVFQCLSPDRPRAEIRRIVITASGGPFRTWSRERIAAATVAEALDHPTWSMGDKITVDSASMMNKTLEVIEAHWLFGLPADRIEVTVHPQSMVHGFVEFVDGSVIAQMCPPDMRTPIQAALTAPDRLDGAAQPFDWTAAATLDFGPPDPVRFPALTLAAEVIERGGTAGAILNAANEAAVAAFLAGAIPFGDLYDLVRAALDAVPVGPATDLDAVRAADGAARQFVRDRIATDRRSRGIATDVARRADR